MKFFSLNKSQGYILGTVLCLVFLGASYFFIYLPVNEKRVEEQRFRILQNVDRNIHSKIDNSLSLLNNILKSYDKKTKQYLDKYIESYSKDKFIISPVSDPVSAILAQNPPAQKKLAQKKMKLTDSVLNAPTLIVDDGTKQITLWSRRLATMSDKPGMLQGSVNFTFNQFIEYLLPDAVFDEYIIFSKGNIIYESFPSGISNAREDSLLNIKNGIGGSYIKDISAGGKDYKLFLQTVTFDSHNKWVLGGLLSKSRYQQERSQLPAGMVMLMVTVVLIMIVIFPWIKLYQMGSKDRLTLMDGSSSIVVSMLLMSLLFFCFFKYNVGVRSNGSPDSKKILGNKISAAFYNETKKMYAVLKHYDTVRAESEIENNIVNLGKPSISYADTGMKNAFRYLDIGSGTKNKFISYDDSAEVKQVFWLDGNGDEKYNWTMDSLNSPKGNYASRNYFSNIARDKSYYIEGDTAKQFYLDQVVSWTTGTFTSVLSIPSIYPAKYVAAISFNMQSVQDAVLPSGYSFAIIDNRGKVLYHSLKARNLNENIKSEFSDSSEIVSCINAGSEGEFNTRYYSKSYAVRMAPLNGLAYFIVIFSDTGYTDIRDIEIYSFTFSMLMSLFLFIVLQLCITFLVSSKRSFFKKQLFDTSWIGPKTFCRKEYMLASAFNMLIILWMVYYFQDTSFFEYLFFLLFSVICISLFLNAILAKRYWVEAKRNNYKLKIIAIRWLSTLLIILNLSAWCLLECQHFSTLLLTELDAIAAGAVLFIFGESVPDKVRDFMASKFSYLHSFSFMALTGLIITSGIPVAFFYITSYNYEQNLGIRHRQTDYANRLLSKPKLKLLNVNSGSADACDSATALCNTAGIYFDGAWISAQPVIDEYKSIDTAVTDLPEAAATTKILGTFRLKMGEKAVQTEKLYIPFSADKSVVYQPLLINTTNAASSVSTFRQTGVANKFLKLTSFNLNYVIPPLFRSEGSFLYWLLLIIALVLFYFIIYNTVKKLFCLNLPDLKIWKELDEKILTNNTLNRFLFVIGLPGAGKVSYILEKLNAKHIKCNDDDLIYDKKNPNATNVFIADLINIPDTGKEIEKDIRWVKFTRELLSPKYKLIIINHFEYNIQDEYTNLAKLNLLEELMLKSRCKIFVLSTIHPVAFLDSINENLLKPDAPSKPAHDLERWHVLLGHYRIAILSITKQETVPVPASHRLIRSETDYTHFLQDMQQSTLDIAGQLQGEEAEGKIDELAYKLQVSAHYFYMYIWQSLTKEEKFLLYDLAEDNLVNSYDDYNLTMLIAKGVIIHKEGSLGFFNKGFRNFILTAIGNAEAMMIKDRIKENGNWSNLKTPLIIVILALLAFLLISQQEAYSKLLTYVAALSAGVPALLKIFSLFDKRSTKSNA